MTIQHLDQRKKVLQKEKERLDEERKIQEYVKSMHSQINLDEELFNIGCLLPFVVHGVCPGSETS
jgi:hypothetical protein